MLQRGILAGDDPPVREFDRGAAEESVIALPFGLGSRSSGFELVLASQFVFGIRLGARITNLACEIRLTHLLENDFGMGANLSAEIRERDFKIKLTHNCLNFED